MDREKLKRLFARLPRNIFLNFYLLPARHAIKMPLGFYGKMRIKHIRRGSIIINGPLSPQMITIGDEKTFGFGSGEASYINIEKGSCVIFEGKASLGKGVTLRVENGSTLHLGRNLSLNSGSSISCSCGIDIGDDFLTGWNVHIRDVDGHPLYMKGSGCRVNQDKTVRIGKHVWVAAHVHILKGTEIPNRCVVAYNSCVLGKFDEENCLIGGYPAKVLKKDISWEY